VTVAARDFILLMLAMGAVTYLPRMLPLAILSRQKLPAWLAEWLELIPPAILSALLAPTLFAQSAPRSLAFGKIELLAALPTLLCALKTRSLAGTVITGMLCYWGLKLALS
jgi:branched-subunit amino acid transport protein